MGALWGMERGAAADAARDRGAAGDGGGDKAEWGERTSR